MPGEFDFIDWIRSQQKPDPRVRLGIGDDLAVLNWDDDTMLVGVDQVLDGVHFDSSIHSPWDIGRKAMNRNLSDCAAMACLPAAAVVTLALPKGCGEDYAKQLFTGMQEAGAMFDCPIVGGDTASWSGKLVVTVTILGKADGVEPITRNGARPGDHVYVTGPLGGSILGRHMTFEPRVALARYLAKNYKLRAMADLSDGLARDLRNICSASGVGASVDTGLLPVHEDVGRLSSSKQAGFHAMTDGEDYELLIVSPDELPEPCVKVGRIKAGHGLTMHRAGSEMRLDSDGWEHAL